MEYLEERYPEPALLPADPAAARARPAPGLSLRRRCSATTTTPPGAGSRTRLGEQLAALELGHDLFSDIAFVPWVLRARDLLGIELPAHLERWLDGWSSGPPSPPSSTWWPRSRDDERDCLSPRRRRRVGRRAPRRGRPAARRRPRPERARARAHPRLDPARARLARAGHRPRACSRSSPREVGLRLRRHGVTGQERLVLYDGGDCIGASASAQLAELAGHPAVAVMAGGLAAWQGDLQRGWSSWTRTGTSSSRASTRCRRSTSCVAGSTIPS